MSARLPAEGPRAVSRAESQAATRKRLLDTAERLVITESIPGLSLRRVCAEAGYTQGAFYSNFASREALLLALLERHAAQQHQSLSELAAEVEQAGIEETLLAVAHWLRSLSAQREWASLAIELRLQAVRDATFGVILDASDGRMIALFAELLEVLVARFGLTPRVPTPAITNTMFALWHALALRGRCEVAPEQIFVITLRCLLGITEA